MAGNIGSERKDELVGTLMKEETLTETAFIEETDDADYLVYYMVFEGCVYMRARFENSRHGIRQKA